MSSFSTSQCFRAMVKLGKSCLVTWHVHAPTNCPLIQGLSTETEGPVKEVIKETSFCGMDIHKTAPGQTKVLPTIKDLGKEMKGGGGGK